MSKLAVALSAVKQPSLWVALALSAVAEAGAMETCLLNASTYHGVNVNILRAIMRVESNFKPGTISNNTNNTKDYGMGGINAIHLPTLHKYGINSNDLLNPCVNSYVAAWHLRRKMNQHGNTWYGIASYHSGTPYYNERYQILLQNALIDFGVLAGEKKPVPPLLPKQRTPVSKPMTDENLRSSTRQQHEAAIHSPMTVLN